MLIEEQVREMGAEAHRLAAEGKLDAASLHVVVDSYQRFIDYLDLLLDSELEIDLGTSPDTVANILTRL